MTPAATSALVESLPSTVAVSPSTGVIVFAVLFGALLAKIILQSVVRLPRRGALRLLDVAIAPMLIVFVIIVVERFRELS